MLTVNGEEGLVFNPDDRNTLLPTPPPDAAAAAALVLGEEDCRCF